MRILHYVSLKDWVIPLTFALHTLGCAGTYHVATYTEDDGSVVNRTVENEIGVEGAQYLSQLQTGRTKLERRCFLDAQKSQDPDGDVTYSLLLSCMGPDWLDMKPGRSLELMIDHQSVVLSGEGDVRRERDPGGTYVTESLNYRISADMLLRLAAARDVDMVVSGESGTLKGYFNDKNFTNFIRFVSEYVKPDQQ